MVPAGASGLLRGDSRVHVSRGVALGGVRTAERRVQPRHDLRGDADRARTEPHLPGETASGVYVLLCTCLMASWLVEFGSEKSPNIRVLLLLLRRWRRRRRLRVVQFFQPSLFVQPRGPINYPSPRCCFSCCLPFAQLYCCYLCARARVADVFRGERRGDRAAPAAGLPVVALALAVAVPLRRAWGEVSAAHVLAEQLPMFGQTQHVARGSAVCMSVVCYVCTQCCCPIASPFNAFNLGAAVVGWVEGLASLR